MVKPNQKHFFASWYDLPHPALCVVTLYQSIMDFYQYTNKFLMCEK